MEKGGELQSVIWMGIGYFWVMGGYITVQGFASTLLNFSCVPLGDISIGVIYFCFAVASLGAPGVIEKWGVKNAIV